MGAGKGDRVAGRSFGAFHIINGNKGVVAPNVRAAPQGAGGHRGLLRQHIEVVSCLFDDVTR